MWNAKTSQAEREAAEKARQRAEQASIVAGLQKILEGDEQLLAFSRGRIAGGWRGKLSLGPEAFFAPDVNIGLTERRLVLQHVHPTSGTPSEIMPHAFEVTSVSALNYSDTETMANEKTGRLLIYLLKDEPVRVRLSGEANCASGQALLEVFKSLTLVQQRAAPGPTKRLCAACNSLLEQTVKFCPYCGARQEEANADSEAASAPSVETTPPEPTPEPAAEATPPAFAEPSAPTIAETIAAEIATEPVAEAAPLVDVAPVAEPTPALTGFLMPDFPALEEEPDFSETPLGEAIEVEAPIEVEASFEAPLEAETMEEASLGASAEMETQEEESEESLAPPLFQIAEEWQPEPMPEPDFEIDAPFVVPPEPPKPAPMPTYNSWEEYAESRPERENA